MTDAFYDAVLGAGVQRYLHEKESLVVVGGNTQPRQGRAASDQAAKATPEWIAIVPGGT